jgi:hypothetical protein
MRRRFWQWVHNRLESAWHWVYYNKLEDIRDKTCLCITEEISLEEARHRYPFHYEVQYLNSKGEKV